MIIAECRTKPRNRVSEAVFDELQLKQSRAADWELACCVQRFGTTPAVIVRRGLEHITGLSAMRPGWGFRERSLTGYSKTFNLHFASSPLQKAQTSDQKWYHKHILKLRSSQPKTPSAPAITLRTASLSYSRKHTMINLCAQLAGALCAALSPLTQCFTIHGCL